MKDEGQERWRICRERYVQYEGMEEVEKRIEGQKRKERRKRMKDGGKKGRRSGGKERYSEGEAYRRNEETRKERKE